MAGRVTEQVTLVGQAPTTRKGRVTEQVTLAGYALSTRKARVTQQVTLVARSNAEAVTAMRSYVVMIG